MYAKAALGAIRHWRELLAVCLFISLLLFLLFASPLYNTQQTFPQRNMAPEVLRWEPIVKEYVQQYGLGEEQVPVLLSIMMQESGGRAADVMQSSESAGFAPGTITDPVASIRQGVIHWKNMLETAGKLGITDLPTIIQSYNYGPGWLYYIKDHGKVGTEELRKQFSALHTTTGVCGWRSPYCYGDYTYAVKVMNFLNSSQGITGGSDLFQEIMEEGLKYEGWPYVWAGETPSTSFDCSGLTKWMYAAAGVHLPRTAQEQYAYTKRISEQELQPGDLVFFTGTSDHAFISHVGVYVGNGKMYNSNSSGVEYSDLTKPVWRSKIYGYGRVPTGGSR
ncbi:MAG: lysozyme family protein [Ectobacillus sp.]